MVLEYLGIGLSLGVTAGVSPGPLMALMISETMQGGMARGIKVSLAPLFTDIPLILAIMFILKHIQNLNPLLGIISLIGSSFLFYFGYRDIKSDSAHVHQTDVKLKSFEKGLLTNLLNPHPYIFWFFIGAPLLIKVDLLERVMFISSFLFGIVGSKICLAVLVEKGKMFIESRHYQRMIKFLGLVLIFFGLLLLKDGIGYLFR
jgi:threonine/homoserine/homoserine lactone efflux protein